MNGRAIPGAYLFRLYVGRHTNPTGLFTFETARSLG